MPKQRLLSFLLIVIISYTRNVYYQIYISMTIISLSSNFLQLYHLYCWMLIYLFQETFLDPCHEALKLHALQWMHQMEQLHETALQQKSITYFVK